MRYFTRAWCTGEYADAEAMTVVAAYAHHLDGITPRLPPDLRALSRVSLHDGRFRAVAFDPSARHLALLLRCGDHQRGYFDLSLIYDDVILLDEAPHGLAALVNDPQAEILYDEVNLLDQDRFEHRLLLWPAGEVTIQFAGLTLTRADVPSRHAP